eukprot:349918-Chlamydomonas_euryale.AAC.6
MRPSIGRSKDVQLETGDVCIHSHLPGCGVEVTAWFSRSRGLSKPTKTLPRCVAQAWLKQA